MGIIGAGGMGAFHADTLHALAGVSVRAVSDPHRPNAAAVRDRVGASIVDDPADLIGSDEIDGLVIASPDETHADFTIAAVRRGLPTLCEKPLATVATDAWRVVDAEITAGRRLVQLGFMREYDPAHRQVRAALNDLGAIDYVRAVHRNANHVPRPIDQIVGQSMVHDIHTVRHLTAAEVTSVRASGSGPSDGSYRHVVALCELSDGAHAILEFDDGGFAYEVAVEVLATDGDVLTGGPVRPVLRRDGSAGVHLGTDWFGWFADAYRIQDQAWVEAVRTASCTGPSTWDGATAQVVVDAILESLASGRTVDIDPQVRPELYA